MTYRKFRALGKACERLLRKRAPYDTGNLAKNAIILEMPDKNTIRLYVDEKIAPYIKYTNEPWTNGKKNPNEGWFDRAVQEIIALIAARVGGVVR